MPTVIPPAVFALGAGGLVCALTLSASVFGWPEGLRQRRAEGDGLSPSARDALLALVPPGHRVRVEAVGEAEAMRFARDLLALLAEAGRVIEDPEVSTLRGIVGEGTLHFAEGDVHTLLVLSPAPAAPPH